MMANLEMHDVVGIVLAGGRSSRMDGQPKAYMKINRLPQWQQCENVLRGLVREVYFSVSSQLQPSLPLNSSRIIDDVFKQPIGPLGGIISAFKSCTDAALFVLACDLPFFDEHAARFLLSRRQPQKKATVFICEGKIEPLCGIYEPTILVDLITGWAQGVTCPRNLLAQLDVEKIVPAKERWLTNVNHVHELASIIDNTCARNVRVQYYASLREMTGRSTEEVLTTCNTVSELFFELRGRYGFNTDMASLRFAINDRLVKANASFASSDTIVFIPPVSGG